MALACCACPDVRVISTLTLCAVLRQARQRKLSALRNGEDADFSPSGGGGGGEDRAVFSPESNGVMAGTRLVMPSELKKGVVRKAKAESKDWGECMLTFDKIREPVSVLCDCICVPVGVSAFERARGM